MTNEEFLKKVKESFYKYLATGSRSNEKLKILHGAISEDILSRIGNKYKVHSLGIGDNREVSMLGRYMEKKVDIAIERNNKVIAALALKFIMSNYSQNSNNYFENMLGETANIRSAGNPYFQIIILPSKVPYFRRDGTISGIEIITAHNLSKYVKLSTDDIQDYMHTPNKTLFYLIDMPEIPSSINNRIELGNFYASNSDFSVRESMEPYGFGGTIIYNDYNKFIDEVCHHIQSI